MSEFEMQPFESTGEIYNRESKARKHQQKELLKILGLTGDLHFQESAEGKGGVIDGLLNGKMIVLRDSESGVFSGTSDGEELSPEEAEATYLLVLEAAKAPK